jgi:recombination protein RecA
MRFLWRRTPLAWHLGKDLNVLKPTSVQAKAPARASVPAKPVPVRSAAPVKPAAKPAAKPAGSVAAPAKAGTAKAAPTPVRRPTPPVSASVATTAIAVHTESKSGKVLVPFDAAAMALQKEIERTVGIDTTHLVQTGYVQNAIHTGVLMYDFVVGGGVAPGRFSILPGREGSGKSTIIDNLAAVCSLQGVPIYWFDAEAALDPNYVGRIFARYGLRFQDMLGVRDPKTGNWVLPPRIRYSQDSIGEHVFKTIHSICKMLPIVRQRPQDGVWFKFLEVKGRPGRWVEDEREGKPQFLFLIDSWPALLTEAMDENHDRSPMAEQARMFASYIRLIKAPVSQRNCLMMSVNQIRQKPGVTQGCLHGDVVVPLVDGRSLTMQEIVDSQIQGQVWSLDETTGKMEPKNITGWHDNGMVENAEDWITIQGQAVDTPNGVVGFTVTPDHEVKIGAGKRWKKAKAVRVGDKLLTKRVDVINGTLREFMLGKFVGDCGLYADKRAGNAAFKLANAEQPEYLEWTRSKLEPHFQFREYKHARGNRVYGTQATAELRTWFDRLEGRRSFRAVTKEFTALSLAVWYMDDGHLAQRSTNSYSAVFTFKRFRDENSEASAISRMLERFDLEHTMHKDCISASLTAAGTKHLCALVAPYIPPSMQYKLIPEYRGQYQEFELDSTPEVVPVEVLVTSVNRGSPRMFRSRRKFDITVADNHNYMVGNKYNGVIVHNSPDYEPGGNALHYFTDVRTQIMRVSPGTLGVGKGTYSEEPGLAGGVDKYVYARLKNTKNKSFTPFRESTIRIRFEHDGQPGDGICQTWDVMQYLLATGQATPIRGQALEMHLLPGTKTSRQQSIFTDGEHIPRAKLKEIVEGPANRQALYKHCLQQIRNGFAFEIEIDSVKRLIANAPAPGSEPADDLLNFSDENTIEA